MQGARVWSLVRELDPACWCKPHGLHQQFGHSEPLLYIREWWALSQNRGSQMPVQGPPCMQAFQRVAVSGLLWHSYLFPAHTPKSRVFKVQDIKQNWRPSGHDGPLSHRPTQLGQNSYIFRAGGQGLELPLFYSCELAVNLKVGRSLMKTPKTFTLKHTKCYWEKLMRL